MALIKIEIAPETKAVFINGVEHAVPQGTAWLEVETAKSGGGGRAMVEDHGTRLNVITTGLDATQSGAGGVSIARMSRA